MGYRIQIDFGPNYAVITLGEIYSLDTQEDLWLLIKDHSSLNGIDYLLVDCSHLEAIDNMGTELFILHDRLASKGVKQLGYCGLDSDGIEWFEQMANRKLLHFVSLDEALKKFRLV